MILDFLKNVCIFVGFGCFALAIIIMLYVSRGSAIGPALIDNIGAGMGVLLCIVIGAIHLMIASLIHKK